MAVTVKFDFDEIERLLKEEVARKFHVEVSDVEWYADDEYVECTLGAAMSTWTNSPGDR